MKKESGSWLVALGCAAAIVSVMGFVGGDLVGHPLLEQLALQREHLLLLLRLRVVEAEQVQLVQDRLFGERFHEIFAGPGGQLHNPPAFGVMNFFLSSAGVAARFGVTAGADHRDGQLHKLDLRIKTRNDVRVRSRKGYYAPKPAVSSGY